MRQPQLQLNAGKDPFNGSLKHTFQHRSKEERVSILIQSRLHRLKNVANEAAPVALRVPVCLWESHSAGLPTPFRCHIVEQHDPLDEQKLFVRIHLQDVGP